MKQLNKTSPLYAGIAISNEPFAVIDIGSTAIRMLIAKTEKNGRLKTLHYAQESSKLGHDTFTSGSIRRSTTEECVTIINNFLLMMPDYGITNAKQIRTIATSALREATNRDTVIDRIYSACGTIVEIIEEIDAARFTYLSFHEFLKHREALGAGNLFLVEMGGSSTEVLFIKDGKVRFSSNFALGSFRLSEMLDRNNTPADQQWQIIDRQIDQTIHKILKTIGKPDNLKIILLGSDARVAAGTLSPNWEKQRLITLSSRQLAKHSEKIIRPTDAKQPPPTPGARQFSLDTTAPALRLYCKLAEALNRKEVFISDISMRHGVLIEMAGRHLLVDALSEQVLEPALEIGKKYRFEENHARQVAALSGELFDELQNEHKLTRWHRLLLTVAALLHDTGLFVSTRSHHKHSMYLIRNSDLFGLSSADILIVALIARYHRRSSPKPEHEGFRDISSADKLVVKKLAAILRIADALDNSHYQRVLKLRFERTSDEFTILANELTDVTIEQVAIREKGSLFEDVYGLKPRIRTRKK